MIWPAVNYQFQVNWMTSWFLPRHFFTGYLSIPPVGTGLNVNTASLKKGGNYIFGFMSGMARGFTSTLFYPHITSWVAVEEAAGRWTLFPFPLYPHHHARRLGWASSVHCSLYFLLKHNPSIKNRVMRPRQWGISGFSIREFLFENEQSAYKKELF